jgi:hypothetical protein
VVENGSPFSSFAEPVAAPLAPVSRVKRTKSQLSDPLQVYFWIGVILLVLVTTGIGLWIAFRESVKNRERTSPRTSAVSGSDMLSQQNLRPGIIPLINRSST